LFLGRIATAAPDDAALAARGRTRAALAARIGTGVARPRRARLRVARRAAESTVVPMSPHCSVFCAVSLDGFIARTDGRIDWLSRVERAGESYGFYDYFASVDTVVIGRRTYETALGFESWPYSGKRCVVLTHQALRARYDEIFYAGDLEALMQLLVSEGASRVYVDGGQVIAQFLQRGFIAEMVVSFIPTLLGRGIPFTGGLDRDVALELTSSQCYASGLVQSRYRVLGD
jgi:dihydrofolate reductase